MFNFQIPATPSVPLFGGGQQTTYQQSQPTYQQQQPQPTYQQQQPQPTYQQQPQPYQQYQQPQQYQQQPLLPQIAQRGTGIPFPKETKFTDLPDDQRANLESIERTLRTAVEQSGALSTMNFVMTTKLTSDIESFEDRVITCETANETCRGHIMSAKRILNQYWKYGESVARMVVASRQVGTDGQVKWVPVISPTDLGLLEEMVLRVESQVLELIDTATALSRQMDQLGQSNKFNVDMLRNTLRHQHDLFMRLAGRVALMEEDLEKLRGSYKAFLIKYRSDLRDPFAPRVGATTSRVGAAAAQIGATTATQSIEASQQSNPPPSVFTTIKPTAPLFTMPAPQFNFNSGSAGNKRLSLSGTQTTQTPNPFLQTPR